MLENPLKTWLKGKSKKYFADAVGIDYRRLWQYTLPLEDPRFRIPPRDVINRIYVKTGGQITALHFYGQAIRPFRLGSNHVIASLQAA